MNNKQLLALLITAITHANAQIASLKELAAQKYSTNIPRILQDLKERKLNPDMQDSIKQQLMYKHLNCFPLSSKIVTLPFNIRSVSFSSNGQHILVIPNDSETTISIYNSSMALLVDLNDFTKKPIILHHDRPIHKAAFSVDGTHILTSGNGCAYIHTVTKSQTSLTLFNNSDIISADFSPDGKFLILRYDKIVFLYTLENLQAPPIILDHTTLLVQSFGAYHTITQAAYSPDGKHIVTGSSEGLLYLWDSTHPQQPPKILGDDGYYAEFAARLLGHHNLITSIAFSKCGRYILTGSRDCTARLWDSAHPQAAPCRIFNYDWPVYAVALSHCGKYALLTTGSYSETTYLWNILDHAAAPLMLKNDHASIVTVTFSQCGRYAITGERIGQHQSVLRFWNLATYTNDTLEDIIQKII